MVYKIDDEKLKSTVAMCDFRMLWIAEVSGAKIWAEVTVFIKMLVERVVPYMY